VRGERAEPEPAAAAPCEPTDRVACEHAHACAGCPLIELTYGEQLETKHERVRSAAALYPALARSAIEAVAAADAIVRYRVRAKLMVGTQPNGGESGAALGLFAKTATTTDHHRVVDIPACRVLSPALHEVAAKLRLLLRDPPKEAGSCLAPDAAGGLLSAFDLREVVDGGARVLVTLVLGTAPRAKDDELERASRAVEELSSTIVGVAVNYREPRAVQVLGATTRALRGASVARDRMGSLYRLATFGSFTQAHPGQARRIEEWIAHRLRAMNDVLDLYGGSGTLSLPIAQRGARVTLVESFQPAAESAERAAREQSLDTFTVRSGDAAAVLNELVSRGARFDAVVTNPPRRGMPPAVRGAIAALEPRLIAYVSCDPESLCRDLDHLLRLGYQPESLRPVDMIPLTDQVETVAFLSRSNPPPRRVAYEDTDIFIIDRLAHDPPPPRGARLGVARVVAGGALATSGLAIGCYSASMEGPLRAALAGSRASRIHFVLCRGITAREGVVERRTRFTRVARVAGHSVLRVTLAGNHEARIEQDLARIGHPVVGEARHGHAPTNRHFQEKYALDRPFLHCIKVEFDHPQTGLHLAAESALPGELATVLGRLGLVALDVAKEVMVG
jgi:tRNA/tmRNA/rRNA uracil-C5-methylase (TrmA/RlmC/RlmD family)